MHLAIERSIDPFSKMKREKQTKLIKNIRTQLVVDLTCSHHVLDFLARIHSHEPNDGEDDDTREDAGKGTRQADDQGIPIFVRFGEGWRGR